MLRVVEGLPPGLLDARVAELEGRLGGPTLIHLPGRHPEPLFVSALLHGNEDSGFLAVQRLLQDYRGRQLPRSLSLFVGNVSAAARGLRHLDGQPDYNRIWPGGQQQDSPEARMLAAITEEMRGRGAFASVDLHNNTGQNPHYACVNRLDNRFFHLATLFSRTVVYFTRPRGVQSLAFAEFCPATTVECGKTGQLHGAEHARDYVEACLRLSEIPDHPVPEHDIDLFHTVATVKVPIQCDFGFDASERDIRFTPDLDHLNFRELPPGTTLAWVRDDNWLRLEAWDEQGEEVSGRYFQVADGELRTRRPFMPSMFTLDERVIRQDCLGYVMERYPLPRLGEA